MLTHRVSLCAFVLSLLVCLCLCLCLCILISLIVGRHLSPFLSFSLPLDRAHDLSARVRGPFAASQLSEKEAHNELQAHEKAMAMLQTRVAESEKRSRKIEHLIYVAGQTAV